MFKQLPASKPEQVEVYLNNQPIQALKGNTVAATVLSHNLRYTRTTPVSGNQRAPFCMMGVCYECLMVINGKPNQRACATYVQDGMRIATQLGVGPEIRNEVSE